MDIESDLEYFREKMSQALISGRQFGKTKAQYELLKDSLVIYHLTQPARVDKYHNIPQSLLVNLFVRKLQDGLDRRRP